jgi:hypothetical protein
MRSTDSLTLAARDSATVTADATATAPVMDSITAGSTRASDSAKAVPSHVLRVHDGQMELSISLPLLTSVTAVALDVSASSLRLDSEDYALHLAFPATIEEASSTAKFLKKQRTLKITAKMA